MQAIDFFSKNGRTFGYIDKQKYFYSWKGKHLGFIQQQEVYTLSGKWIGFIKNGYIYDHRGSAILYSKGAKNGPIPQLPIIPPIKSCPQPPRKCCQAEIPPTHPLVGYVWSKITPDVFFNTEYSDYIEA